MPKKLWTYKAESHKLYVKHRSDPNAHANPQFHKDQKQAASLFVRGNNFKRH